MKDTKNEPSITEPSNYIDSPADFISFYELVKELTGKTIKEIYNDYDGGDKNDR